MLAVPPASELRREAAILREIAADDPAAVALCDAVEEITDAGGFVRHGPRETKPRPLLPEWKKEPSENP